MLQDTLCRKRILLSVSLKDFRLLGRRLAVSTQVAAAERHCRSETTAAMSNVNPVSAPHLRDREIVIDKRSPRDPLPGPAGETAIASRNWTTRAVLVWVVAHGNSVSVMLDASGFPTVERRHAADR
ncbi:hypothetical protein RFM41_30320 [Mesorhizobium sp. VK25A]|uniref:Transposase DDE domain-containing protein n=1 Tax=Mesorhizobium vachelliae TaxID=3072309 RepID=A0ABU5AC28_9HYPH|nr:hypothetical protein [Mesorhizobium sp. VK25A]MDX8535264.1 hypothetical protein [Mesorhizobium sp. VK25D]MDX8548065.1 hypothetical protein [Mesorhizobium sp. VK25A]